MEDLLQDITIYHKTEKGYTRFNKKASLRNTSYLNRSKTGVETSDNGIVRVFDTRGYNMSWRCEKGDIIVARRIKDTITKAPLTELREKYGKHYVYEVKSIDIFDFTNPRLNQINHIKIGIR